MGSAHTHLHLSIRLIVLHMRPIWQQIPDQLARRAGNEAGGVRLIGQQTSEAVNGDAGAQGFFFTVHHM